MTNNIIEQSQDEDPEQQIAEWINKTKNDILATFNNNNNEIEMNQMMNNADHPELSETIASELTMTIDMFDEESKRRSFSYIKRYQASVAQELNAQKENQRVKNQEKERLRKMREELRHANHNENV